jgi:hypothetical protein
MRTRSKTPKPEPVVPEKSIIEKPKKAPSRPKAPPKPKKDYFTPREVTVNHQSLLAEFYPQYKKELTRLVVLFFSLFNYHFGVPLGGDVSKVELPEQIKNKSFIFTQEFCKNVWIRYTSGVSYIVNYYLNYNNTDEINKDLIDTDFERMMEDFINSFLKSNIVKAFKLPEDLLNCFNFKEYAIIRPQEMSIEYAFSLLTNEQKIEIMVKCLEFSFENDSVYSVSDREIVVYRGIVGYNINDKSLFLQPAKGFVSTSILESVAIDHTDIKYTFDKLLPSNRNLKDNFIIEMRVPPGVKFIDYNNKIIEDDELNEWQKELIFPPGIQFNFIGTSKTTSGYDKLIVEVVGGNTSFGESKQLKKIIDYLLSL